MKNIKFLVIGILFGIILSKSDLCEDALSKLKEVENIAFGLPVYLVSSYNAEGLKEIKKYLEFGKTVALLGSSGVGKSTMINTIVGKNLLKTGDIRSDDDKGKHVTTYRQLISLESGGNIIDTPCMREIQVWDSEESLDNYFDDIIALESSCKFKTCSHKSELGCAVIEALKSGELDAKRYENYSKLKKENQYNSMRKEISASKIEREKWKDTAKFIKKHYKNHPKNKV